MSRELDCPRDPPDNKREIFDDEIPAKHPNFLGPVEEFRNTPPRHSVEPINSGRPGEPAGRQVVEPSIAGLQFTHARQVADQSLPRILVSQRSLDEGNHPFHTINEDRLQELLARWKSVI